MLGLGMAMQTPDDAHLIATNEEIGDGLERKEPTWSGDIPVPVLVDAIAPQEICPPQALQPTRSAYRLIDWLSAIALLVMSLALLFLIWRSPL
jgi:hypothetical protein